MAEEPQPGATIEDYLLEERRFPPSEEFKKHTLVASPFLYDDANEDWQGFWARQAAELLDWDEEWHTIPSGTSPSPSGSWAASSTSATTPWTAT
jgi:hypothetical protein